MKRQGKPLSLKAKEPEEHANKFQLMNSKLIQKLTASLSIMLVLMLGFSSQSAQAQQDTRYSQYMFNGLVLNPAYGGSVEGASLSAFYRNQWVGIDGAPVTYSFSGHSRLGDRVGVGGYVQRDEIGVTNTTSAFLTYAYRIPFANANVAIGLNGGVDFYSANLTDVQGLPGTTGPVDPVFNEDESRLMPNFGVGIYYHSEYFYLGASTPRLLENKFDTPTKKARQYRHYLGTVGIVLPILPQVKVNPSMLFKTVPAEAPYQFDFNLNLIFMDMVWIGSSYRTGKEFGPESVDFLAGFMLRNGLRMGYAYDLTLTELDQFTSGSHEITIGWDLRKNNDMIITPRYFQGTRKQLSEKGDGSGLELSPFVFPVMRHLQNEKLCLSQQVIRKIEANLYLMRNAVTYLSLFVTLWLAVNILSSDKAMAQQEAHYTQYMFNGLVLNPAYAGSRDVMSAVAFYRHQWQGIDKAPRTVSLSLHGAASEKVGLGIHMENDRLGVHNRFNLHGSYAYRFRLGYGQMSLGLRAGFHNYNSRWTETQLQDPDDQVFHTNENKLLPNFGFGAFYFTNQLFIGVSVPKILEQDISITKVAKERRHYFLTAGLLIPMGVNLDLRPSMMMKAVPGDAPISTDINLSLLIQRALSLGVSYRIKDSWDFLVEYQLNHHLRLGYSYDLTATELRHENSGSHEIMLGYDFSFDRERIISPRHFQQMQLFYEPALLEGTTQLNEVEAHHCIHVLRKKPGDKIHIVDGKGGLYEVAITEIQGRKRCHFEVLSKQEEVGIPPYELHLAIAPTKNISRIEWLLEKATELGISEITPFIAQHSERKAVKQERLNKILITAMKQSLRASLPKLNEARSLQQFLKEQASNQDQKYIAHLHPDHEHLSAHYDGSPMLVMVGPEGDFSEQEIEAAKTAGFKGISLGSSRLRTETAGMLVVAFCNLYCISGQCRLKGDANFAITDHDCVQIVNENW